jgi:hypothetical protein
VRWIYHTCGCAVVITDKKGEIHEGEKFCFYDVAQKNLNTPAGLSRIKKMTLHVCFSAIRIIFLPENQKRKKFMDLGEDV